MPSRRTLAMTLLAFLIALPLTPVGVSFFLCPDMDWYADHFPERTAFMAYREEQARAAGKPFAVRCEPVPWEAIPPLLRRGVVALEDDRFWQHPGFDFEAIRKAWEYNREKGKVRRGASTITQQLAKNLWLSPRRSWSRKVLEAVLTLRLERALTKRRILELYLNVIEWGPGVFGVKAAAERHFHRAPGELTPEQIALLIAAIPSPLRSDPANPSEYLDGRQRAVLERLGMAGDAPTPEEPPAEGHTP